MPNESSNHEIIELSKASARIEESIASVNDRLRRLELGIESVPNLQTSVAVMSAELKGARADIEKIQAAASDRYSRIQAKMLEVDTTVKQHVSNHVTKAMAPFESKVHTMWWAGRWIVGLFGGGMLLAVGAYFQ